MKKMCRLLLACILAAAVLSISVSAEEACYEMDELSCRWVELSSEGCLENRPVVQNSGTINLSIPANTILPLDGNVSLVSGETISYDCTYTPKSASVDFGFVAPDGLFYSVGGSNGKINATIRVNQRGSYTLAICNNSNSAVTVTGTVNY